MNPDTPRSDAGAPSADPLIDEIRRIRREISERFGNDVRRLSERLREIQRESRANVRRRPDSERRNAG
ncbi:MAG: hypothetical protein KIS87_01355 [Phycisphaeraceae bacterium]|nr:hypothetical protein [Phycisphaeraceae bacterium]